MFKKPGRHIKQNAKIVTVIFSALWAIAGIILFVVSVVQGVQIERPAIGVLVGVALGGGIAALGIWSTWALSLLFYGFGVIVERCEQPENKIVAERKRNESIFME